MQLPGQIAIVTGGASGMGRACIETFTQLGARAVSWDINAQESEEAEIHCDVTSTDSVEQAMQETIERFGVPRICINCAGIAPAKRMVGREGPMPLENFEKVIQINLIGTFNVMRVAAHQMSQLEPVGEDAERGVIVNTASIAAYEGQIGQMAYSASKGGVI